ncbi:sigma factor [Gulosibacter sediminis]|uniref:sigma factor n=1 Tax=Gulosibacter sediminis TaxID=1729695 RepID=UPI0024A7FA09|nr:sigma factor [Gulosibacter sediminis]
MSEQLRAEVTGTAIMAAVQSRRAWAAGRVRAHQVDDVLQLAATEAWQKRGTYDPARGPLQAWAHGFVRIAVQRVIHGDGRHEQDRIADDVGEPHIADRVRLDSDDVLDRLVGQHSAAVVLQALHAAVSETEWQVMLEVTIGDLTTRQAAQLHHLSERRVQEIHATVTDLAHVIVTATHRAEQLSSTAITPREMASEILSCLPADFRPWHGVITKLLTGNPLTRSEVAAELGVTKKTVSNRYPAVRRLASVAAETLAAHRPTT